MKWASIAVLFSVVALSAAFGRIGETEAQILQRYGSPDTTIRVDDRETLEKFSWNDFRVLVYFLDGTSQGELIVGYRSVGETMSDGDINALLAANAGGSEWEALDSRRAERREWRLRDGTLLAYYNRGRIEPGLMIMTRAMRSKLALDHARNSRVDVAGF